jgi:hypothetical protein
MTKKRSAKKVQILKMAKIAKTPKIRPPKQETKRVTLAIPLDVLEAFAQASIVSGNTRNNLLLHALKEFAPAMEKYADAKSKDSNGRYGIYPPRFVDIEQEEAERQEIEYQNSMRPVGVLGRY